MGFVHLTQLVWKPIALPISTVLFYPAIAGLLSVYPSYLHLLLQCSYLARNDLILFHPCI